MRFVIYFGIIFVITFILLLSLGLVPELLNKNGGDSLNVLWDKAQNFSVDEQNIINENPTRIVIEKIGVDSTISNPNTTNVSTLDEYLKTGAVRYPGSGYPGLGNMFIFGHSTGIKVVQNQAYKTFNGLKDLKAGDMIQVYGTSKIYLYQVTTVTLIDQNQALVEFGSQKNMLTLSTCNTFGAKSERYVVKADYLGTN